jgi:hypothetical protein
MGYISTLTALLVVAGLLVVPLLSVEDGGRSDYSEPPALENGTAILTGKDGGEYSEPSMVENETIILADDGGGTDSIGIPNCLVSPWICI